MDVKSMNVAQTIEELEKYPESMNVKIVQLHDIVHGIFQFNSIEVSHEKEELQFAFDNQKPLFHKEEHNLGVLLYQIKNLVKDTEKQIEVEKFLVCTREIGLIIPAQVTKDTMYLKHIKSKKEFADKSSMVHYDGLDDTIFLEFMK